MVRVACAIPTIGRETLDAAIDSARQFDQVIVIADDLDIAARPGVQHARTGRRFDRYGSACWNLAAYLTDCDWIAGLGDDDQWTDGAAERIRQAITARPEVDVWIPGLQYADGERVCTSEGLRPGNVAVPIARPTAWWQVPMAARHAVHDGYTDYAHIADLAAAGLTLGWLGQAVYLVRPASPGRFGGGRP